MLEWTDASDGGGGEVVVQVFALISEGCNVLYGTRKARAVPYERIIEITIGLQRMLAPELQQDVVSSSRGTPARRQ